MYIAGGQRCLADIYAPKAPANMQRSLASLRLVGEVLHLVKDPYQQYGGSPNSAVPFYDWNPVPECTLSEHGCKQIMGSEHLEANGGVRLNRD